MRRKENTVTETKVKAGRKKTFTVEEEEACSAMNEGRKQKGRALIEKMLQVK